jgi:hypothetical protein
MGAFNPLHEREPETMNAVQNAAATPRANIFMPTHDQLVSTYRSITEQAEKNGKLVALKHAPIGASKAAAYNITKPGTLGTSRNVFDIRGELYLKSQVVAPNAQPKWFKVGPAPLF